MRTAPESAAILPVTASVAPVVVTSASATVAPQAAAVAAELAAPVTLTVQPQSPAAIMAELPPAVHATRVEPKAPSPDIVAEEVVREERPVSSFQPTAAPLVRPEQVLKLDWQTDLTQIETNPDKLRAARVQTDEDAPAPLPKRVRPAVPLLDDGPLLQVETRAHEAAVPPPAGPTGPGSTAVSP